MLYGSPARPNELDLPTPPWPTLTNHIAHKNAFTLGIDYVYTYLLSISKTAELGYNDPTLFHLAIQIKVLRYRAGRCKTPMVQ
ncbi:hypothetical protein PTNB73_02879 [Pyrenophora teres f. teres]|uniref:Uncharacterized protein n=1 Tax=Pyrenophora teres f. teres TaxID=97479 RepID=A0A6S6W322_9PLEO|nr:hypothetical protein HRS9122_03636 [Pyrenophora teres f. teres]KAE8865786.1 hypothetical protein PTNB29_02933 [Pyrenophora teres f. teres]KAE8871420.1 hypothetical protein PTNB73_02879 [Pyrenophora teres f. teres]CAE7175683.1 hypothetical protein PTTW11_05858 [Pyrenophora teres f. teres]